MKTFIKIFIIFTSLLSNILSQQINISRIELMPNHPNPYLMRDWKNVTLGYDSIVFNSQLQGEYLPLISFYDNTVNYPQHGSFRLHAVVGTKSPSSSEAINVIPAVIGATLAGIDKSNQDGKNFVLMCEEFFNKRESENVYLNHPQSTSGDDWWYETMPNVFFYQLYDLYPGTGDFNYQFITIAERWLSAVKAMGGDTSPWHIPNMNYRAFELSTMTPRPDGVIEPEAAGAIAWILYNAYVVTGEKKYLTGAEWCIEFLLSLSVNPSYEIQLPYGVLTAARMNAELGTGYNIEKLINWCFNNYAHRNWGTVTGNWGGYDVNGLIGETYNNDGNDYAFLMNTLEQAGALVPLVRYDERFARAIGKWILNAANSTRLFYTNYLPDENQDSEEWSHQYDPYSYIGHEAIKESKDGKSPYATGDAISGGWGSTNLALYGSSHVGIFGGIIEMTNIEQILKLNLRKTDYFNHSAYPSYLFFNPYNESKSITINTGSGNYDIYEMLSNSFLQRNISGEVSFDIPPDDAVVIVLVPANGNVTYDLDRMLVNGITADYKSGQSFNSPPRIKSLAPEKSILTVQDSTNIYCTAHDPDNDQLTYSWSSSGGVIAGTGSIVNFYSGDTKGDFIVICIVGDTNGATTSDTISIEVADKINNPPQINYLNADPRKIDLNSSSEITCSASDPDEDDITFTWSSNSGSFSGSGNKITWNSTSIPGDYFIRCTVNDGTSQVTDSILIIVRDFSQTQTGNLVLYLPFNGSAVDESGYNNPVLTYQAYAVADRFSAPGKAFFFDGADDHLLITNSPLLNFQNSVSVNFWIKVSSFFDRESYPLSHGNWDNRWKISVTDKKIRWTINTSYGIADLDSETELLRDSLYNISALYNGSDFELYVNSKLEAYRKWQGSIKQTNYDIVVGQSLPGNYNYGFRGTLDDIRIYDYAVSMEQIKAFYDLPTHIADEKTPVPERLFLAQNFPNPFNSTTVIKISIPEPGSSNVLLEVYNILGNNLITLLDEPLSPGFYKIDFNAGKLGISSGVYFYKLSTDSHTETKKMIYLR